MDFELQEEHRIFRDSLRKFLEAEIRPYDERWRRPDTQGDQGRADAESRPRHNPDPGMGRYAT